MAQTIVVRETGGPDKLRLENAPDPVPGPGEARIRQGAIGVNFIDVYYRSGLYKAAALPFVPGQEGAGVVDAIGPDVRDVAVGDRVAYAGIQGAYADLRILPAARLVRIPDGIDDRTAAAMMLKGMTAEYLLLRCARVQRGDTILFHAAAGGVGSLACQWARALGAHVIGTAGGPDKVERARAVGCHDVIDTHREEIAPRVRELTGGRGVTAVFDGVGKTTFLASLDSLRPRGILVLFGQASGPVPPFDPQALAARGSLFLTRPTLNQYVAAREELVASAAALFGVVQRGDVRVDVTRTYPLAEVAVAHADLEARRTVGSVVLMTS